MHDIYDLMGKYMYLHEKQVRDSYFHICLKIKFQHLQTKIYTTKIQKNNFISWVIFILNQVYQIIVFQNKQFFTYQRCVKPAG